MDAVSEPIETVAPSLLEQHLAINSDPCPLCGYNLHRLRGIACPECGQLLELRVAAVAPRFAAFYAGLLGLAGGLGFSVLLLIYGFWSGLRHGMQDMVVGMIVLLIDAIVFGVLLALWLGKSSQIRRAAPAIRWGLAASAWLLALFGLACFTIAIDF